VSKPTLTDEQRGALLESIANALDACSEAGGRLDWEQDSPVERIGPTDHRYDHDAEPWIAQHAFSGLHSATLSLYWYDGPQPPA
jgi:hypothetical protein